MKPLLIGLLLLVVSSDCIAQTKKFDGDFTIIFGGCFRNDSVNLKLDGKQIVTNYKLESNSAGSAGFSVIQDRNYLLIKSFQHVDTLPRVSITPSLDIELSVDNKWILYSYDLNNGKVIVIEYCWEQTAEHKRTITMKQQKGTFYFF